MHTPPPERRPLFAADPARRPLFRRPPGGYTLWIIILIFWGAAHVLDVPVWALAIVVLPPLLPVAFFIYVGAKVGQMDNERQERAHHDRERRQWERQQWEQNH